MDTYHYELNLQGDVIAILDSSGNRVVEYTYDAWGKLLGISGSMKDSLGKANPLRYRGYVYDDETGLYYCQSRYYDPQTHRFLNSDTFAATGQTLIGNNMFAYCGNNPVMRIDTDGKRWEYAIEDVVTESEENKDGSYSVTTSITYSYKQTFLGVTMYESPESETAIFSYTISNTGVIIFDNSQDNAPYLTIDSICDTLANEMLNHTREKAADSLSLRTVEGISDELYWHYISYSLYILRANSGEANVGGMHKNKPGYDSNAFMFECM